MSGRAVRKALKQREDNSLEPADDSGPESVPPPKSRFPHFLALEEADDNHCQDDDVIDHNMDAALGGNDDLNTSATIESGKWGKKDEIAKSQSPSKSRRKKTRGSRKQKAHDKSRDGEAFEEMLLQFKNSYGVGISSHNESGKKEDQTPGEEEEVLRLSFKNLNYEVEMARKFGKKDGRYRRRTRFDNRMPLVKRSPVTCSGISMVETGELDEFRYTHSSRYREQQMMFLQLLATNQPDPIVDFVRHNKEHLDAHLVFADLTILTDGDRTFAQDLVERVICMLQLAFPPAFRLGKSTVPYKYEENRCLFGALLRHARHLADMSCWISCLEVAKVIWSLDPADPVAILWWMDSIAAKGECWDFIIKFAAAHAERVEWLASWQFSLVLAHFSQGHEEVARKQAFSAIKRFPWILPKLKNVAKGIKELRPEMTVDLDEQGARGCELMAECFALRSATSWSKRECNKWLTETVNQYLEQALSVSELVLDDFLPPAEILRQIIILDIGPLRRFVGSDTFSHDPFPPDNPATHFYQDFVEENLTTTAFRNPLMPVQEERREVVEGPHQAGGRQAGERDADAQNAPAGFQRMLQALFEFVGGRNEPEGPGTGNQNNDAIDWEEEAALGAAFDDEVDPRNERHPDADD